jgi:hypothetical protein
MIDIILSDLEYALSKEEGCFPMSVTECPKIPEANVNSPVLAKIMREKLCDLNAEDLTKQIEQFADENFIVSEDSITCLNDNGGGHTVYALKAYASKELVEDSDCDVVNGLKVYLAMSMFKTILALKSKGNGFLQWRRRPSVESRDGLNDLEGRWDCVEVYCYMRLSVWE